MSEHIRHIKLYNSGPVAIDNCVITLENGDRFRDNNVAATSETKC